MFIRGLLDKDWEKIQKKVNSLKLQLDILVAFKEGPPPPPPQAQYTSPNIWHTFLTCYDFESIL